VAADDLELNARRVQKPELDRRDRVPWMRTCTDFVECYAVRLYARKVVPRAPNFWALRRVSSNFERA
jgi:hypothetical protein